MQDQNLNQQPGGVFLNGKAQIIEMLQYMGREEKQRLLNNIRLKNPALANELMERSFSFSHIENLYTDDLMTLIDHIDAQIFGVALKGQKASFQRKVLQAAPRGYAEKAFNVMNTKISNEREIVKKAQNKIINTLIGLSKKGSINLSQ